MVSFPRHTDIYPVLFRDSIISEIEESTEKNDVNNPSKYELTHRFPSNKPFKTNHDEALKEKILRKNIKKK